MGLFECCTDWVLPDLVGLPSLLSKASMVSGLGFGVALFRAVGAGVKDF